MDFQSGLLFLSGWAFSFLAHEAGHIGTTYLSGGEVKKFKISVSNPQLFMEVSDREKFILSVLAGPTSQLAVGHYFKDRQDYFIKGVFYGSHLHMLAYAIRGTGDFKSLSRQTGLDRDYYRLFFAVHTISGLLGLHDKYKLSLGTGFSWTTRGTAESDFFVSLNKQNKQDFLIDFSFGFRPLEHVSFGYGWMAELRAKDKAEIVKSDTDFKMFDKVDYKRGEYVYFKGYYKQASLKLKLQTQERIQIECPTLCRRKTDDTIKLIPELAIELPYKNFFLKASISTNKADFMAGVEF